MSDMSTCNTGQNMFSLENVPVHMCPDTAIFLTLHHTRNREENQDVSVTSKISKKQKGGWPQNQTRANIRTCLTLA